MLHRSNHRMRLRIACLAVAAAPAWWGICAAGVGPENVLLVVNARSEASLTVANHYQALRGIPPENVLYLDWDPLQTTTDMATFRDKILQPVIEAVLARGSGIDCVAYSADFPWGVRLEEDIRAFVREHPEVLPSRPEQAEGGDEGEARDDPLARWPKPLTPVGSINGLTYLYLPVLAAAPPAYMNLRENQYMRRATPEQDGVPTLGFSSTLCFGPNGEVWGPARDWPQARGVDPQAAESRRRYLLSMVLGVVENEKNRGNTLPEILHYLERSAKADAAFPPGTIYYVRNDDIRSKTRHPAFPEAVEQLERLGVRGEIVFGIMPEEKHDCQGVMMGTAQFQWEESGSEIRPGALCDHLTSLGGVMHRNGGQTPLSEFLRHGAAAASGTVTEPFAIQEKFPFAMLHVHYARGCTAAEAFYQSVYGPYQLLIVGDPLCRPWANVPRVTLDGLPGPIVSGELRLRATAHFPRPGLPDPLGGGETFAFEYYLDGEMRNRGRPGEECLLNTAAWGDGRHELRVVAVEKGLIATRGSLVLDVVFRNHDREIQVQAESPDRLAFGQIIAVEARSPGAMALVLRHNGRVLDRCLGATGRLTADTRRLGRGPVSLQVAALGRGGEDSNVYSAPLRFDIE
ncbi:MAG: hypothetical protein GYA33_03845 [Thermogutta sp.]|nr:hypothetical protein [Thermogutta sp.]